MINQRLLKAKGLIMSIGLVLFKVVKVCRSVCSASFVTIFVAVLTLQIGLVTPSLAQEEAVQDKESREVEQETVKLKPTIRIIENDQKSYDKVSCDKIILMEIPEENENKPLLERKRECLSRLRVFQ